MRAPSWRPSDIHLWWIVHVFTLQHMEDRHEQFSHYCNDRYLVVLPLFQLCVEPSKIWIVTPMNRRLNTLNEDPA